MGPIWCPETSVNDYYSTLRRSHQHCGGSLTPGVLLSYLLTHQSTHPSIRTPGGVADQSVYTTSSPSLTHFMLGSVILVCSGRAAETKSGLSSFRTVTSFWACWQTVLLRRVLILMLYSPAGKATWLAAKTGVTICTTVILHLRYNK
jgi:hypothetical protein